MMEKVVKKQEKNNKFNPLVSVVMPVYNGENYVKEAIDSVLNQTYKNIEIIVVNDGSKDNTDEICKSYGNKIRYYKKENGGVATALNFGISKMNGEYFSWLSHDDLYKENKIEKEIEVLSNLENKETIIFSNFELMNEFGKTFSKTNYSSFYTSEELCHSIFPVIRGCINGDTILINKKCFEKVGLFREDLHCTQDYDLWFKLFAEYPSYLVLEHLVRYRIHDKQDTNNYPSASSESDSLWTRIISKLTLKEVESWGQNPIETLMYLYYQMKCAKYENAMKEIWNLTKKIYSKYKPKVSILMPVYNEEKYIEESINSILEQSYGCFELIVIDDNSTDESYKIVKEIAKKDFRIKLYKNEFNKGIVGGLNTGLKYASGEYVTRQDADDISTFIRLESQISVLKHNKELGYVATNISLINKDGKTTNENIYYPNVAPIEYELAFGNPIPNATIMYNKNLIDKYKLKFNGNINVAEDYNFLLNYVLTTKTKGYFIPEGLYDYRILEDSEFHKNADLAISKSIEYAKEYYTSLTNEYNENFDNISFAEANLKISDEHLKDAISIYLELLMTCKEKFNWTKEELLGTYNYIANKINLGHQKTQFKIIKELEKSPNNIKSSKLKTLISKAKHYYKTNGLKKTVIKVLKFPFKFIKRK